MYLFVLPPLLPLASFLWVFLTRFEDLISIPPVKAAKTKAVIQVSKNKKNGKNCLKQQYFK